MRDTEKRKKEELRSYLENRFKVIDYDDRYNYLDSFNLKTVFTTNIDDLLYKIFDQSQHHYLNDITIYGPKRVMTEKLLS